MNIIFTSETTYIAHSLATDVSTKSAAHKNIDKMVATVGGYAFQAIVRIYMHQKLSTYKLYVRFTLKQAKTYSVNHSRQTFESRECMDLPLRNFVHSYSIARAIIKGIS